MKQIKFLHRNRNLKGQLAYQIKMPNFDTPNRRKIAMLGKITFKTVSKYHGIDLHYGGIKNTRRLSSLWIKQLESMSFRKNS